ncbi:hypothetical protein CVT26_004618 [Gymnopilus dilepis]|uniref:Uncharacterized protein n=1 Tax=Gymnopilus dilepis TaxID=231916 RepID=A0A409YJ88_9AGAR|nr:hypothetical protein CVT26_004618 [Gymnopilus dilepis]
MQRYPSTSLPSLHRSKYESRRPFAPPRSMYISPPSSQSTSSGPRSSKNRPRPSKSPSVTLPTPRPSGSSRINPSPSSSSTSVPIPTSTPARSQKDAPKYVSPSHNSSNILPHQPHSPDADAPPTKTSVIHTPLSPPCTSDEIPEETSNNISPSTSSVHSTITTSSSTSVANAKSNEGGLSGQFGATSAQADAAGTLFFSVYPSPLIKTDTLKYIFSPDTFSKTKWDPELLLESTEYFSRQQFIQSQIDCAKAIAEQIHAAKVLHENTILLDAMWKGMDFQRLDYRTGLDVAAAARATLLAEAEVVRRQIDSCEAQLKFLYDKLESAKARASRAGFQFSSIASGPPPV